MELKLYERSLQALLSSVPRSCVLARLASLAQTGELAHRLFESRNLIISNVPKVGGKGLRRNGYRLSLPSFSSFLPRQLFACLLLSRLPHYLRAWNRLEKNPPKRFPISLHDLCTLLPSPWSLEQAKPFFVALVTNFNACLVQEDRGGRDLTNHQ